MARLPFGTSRIMSLSREEFASSIEKLGPHKRGADGHPIFALETGSVEIRYAAAASKIFGGLLLLPQAHVELVFENAPETIEAEFLHRFDIAFQRGGG